MALPPYFYVTGPDPFERGRALGAQIGDHIRRSIEIYDAVFRHQTGMAWQTVVDYAQRFREVIEGFDSGILAEIDGMADGARLPREDLLAINVRSEVMFGLKNSRETSHECTAYFAGSSATSDGHILMGQNWDWKPECVETTLLVEQDQGPDLPSFFTVVEAGLVAKTGMNSAGLGLATNTLIGPMDLGEPNVPYHLLLRRILNSWTIEAAAEAVVGCHRSASANYLIGSSQGVGVNFETSAGGVEGVRVIHPESGVIGHSNNFTCDIDFTDLGTEAFPDSPHRVAEMSRRLTELSGALDVGGLKGILTSHETTYPSSICRHPDEAQAPLDRLATDASVVYELTKGTADIVLGRPCEGEYRTFVPRWTEAAA